MHDQETFEEIVIQERPYPDEQPPDEPQPEHPEPPDEPPKIDPETRRLGKFYVGDVVIEYELDRARKILAGFVVVRCEHMFYMHAFEYIAIHPSFRYVEPGFNIPEYSVSMTDDGVVSVMEVA